MNNFCITVPTARLQEVDTKLAKLAKRAAKLSLAVVYGYQTAIMTGRKLNPKTKKFESAEMDVTVVHASFPPVKLSGWTLAAVLEPFTGEANLIHGVPGIGDVDPKWRDIVGQCDHCGRSRHRKETFVVRHEDGTEKSVGRTCIADFLGHRDPKALLTYFAWLAERMEEFEAIGAGFRDEDEGGYWSMYSTPIDGMDVWLSWVCREVGENGWVSRTAARDRGTMATADAAWSDMDCYLRPACGADRRRALLMDPPTSADLSYAQAALEWVRTDAGIAAETSDYIFNLRSICAEDTINTSKSFHTGVSASLIGAYRRHLEKTVKAQEIADMPESQYIGEIKGRRDFEATITAEIDIPGDWGTSTLYKMLMDDGAVLAWFSSNGMSRSFVREDGRGDCECAHVGDRVVIKATVKAHRVYNGIKETQLSRAKLLSMSVKEAA